MSIQGFEPRGTDIANKLIAYNNLVDNRNGKLSLTPGTEGVYQKSDTIQYTTDNETRLRRSEEQPDSHVIVDRDTHRLHKASFFCEIPGMLFVKPD